MIKTEIIKIVEKPVWVLILAASAFYFGGLFLFSHFVWSADVYEINYKSDTGFEEYIGMVRLIDLLRYVLSPLYIFIISFIILGVLKIGLIINDIKFNDKLLFKTIILGTFILSLPLWVKAVWFVLVRENYSMDEVKFFYPLSFLYFFDPTEMHFNIAKALGRINIYHLAFMAFMASFIKHYSDINWYRSFGIVIYTYGLGLVLLQLIIILFYI
ncbi:MAG: hypothetical protein JNK09_01370 [Prolixibacteraceae bacterium]|nr:hypothetical protein [Prolixibacteraceae bacterium]